MLSFYGESNLQTGRITGSAGEEDELVRDREKKSDFRKLVKSEGRWPQVSCRDTETCSVTLRPFSPSFRLHNVTKCIFNSKHRTEITFFSTNYTQTVAKVSGNTELTVKMPYETRFYFLSLSALQGALFSDLYDQELMK